MPLTLVTGPANAEKARVLLDGCRAAADRGALLVVPTVADVERYRRELTEAGAILGPRVLRFADLFEEVARRTGAPGRVLGPLARERVALAAVRATELEALAAAAQTPGFARALCALVDELEEERVAPERLAGALRAWAAGDDERWRYGRELAALYGAYRDRLRRLGAVDGPLHRAGALDALRAALLRRAPTFGPTYPRIMVA